MYFNVFRRPESSQKYNCASAHQNDGFLLGREEADKCRLCFPGFACKLATSLVKGIKINVHYIIVFVLVFELRVNIVFVN